jgi:hypothetical protein
MEPLFKNLLENKRVYSLNVRYWSRLLHRVTDAKRMSIQENVLTRTFNDGSRFYDGNPIFDAIIDNKKAIRIIQEQPDSNELNISAWIDNTEIYGQRLEELVINLELTKESQAIAKDLLIF